MPLRSAAVVVAVLFVAWAGLVAADVTITSPDGAVAVDFVGQSGQIKLFPSAESKKFIKIKWSKLSEVDASGATVQSASSLASKTFEWVGPESVTVQGHAATKVTLQSVLQINGAPSARPHFNVSAYLFTTSVTLSDGDSTVEVPRNSLKFSIGVDGWPFESASNFLTLSAQVETPKNKDGAKDKADSTKSHTRFDFDDSHIVLQNTAIADGVQVNINSTVEGKNVEWKFPAFTERLDYDPTLGLESAATAAAAAAIPMMALLALLASAAASFVC